MASATEAEGGVLSDTLTVGESRNAHLLDTTAHGVLVRQGLDKDGIDADVPEFLGPREGLIPAVDERVRPRQDEDVLPVVSSVACGLDPGVRLAP